VGNKAEELASAQSCSGKAVGRRRMNLAPAYELTIERGLELMQKDEYLEVTPQSVRLRKIHLTESERAKQSRKE
jgi:predicted membrane GTPase involved in stress response